MSVLSITAPLFTADDERLERETLTPEEIDAANQDILGTFSFEETDEMKVHGPVELQKALDEIPHEEKEAYLEALERVPHLVQTESNPILFLRSENYNVST
jgi:hypothetical protein